MSNEISTGTGRVVRDGGFILNPGSVVQINEFHGEKYGGGRGGWIGAFVLVTEVKSWGVQGFVQCIKDHDTHTQAYIRLANGEFDYVGEAALQPASDE